MPTPQNIPATPLNHTANTSQDQEQPLISFIVTAYNLPAEMLTECLESIIGLSLSATEREIIVVDDGSDEPAIGYIDQLLPHIIYIRQPNQGAAAARNTGLQMARGEYIQFVDGDDRLLRAPYEHCLDIVRFIMPYKQTDKRPDMVVFHGTEKDDAEVPFNVEGPISGAAYMHANNLRSPVWGYIFRRAILGTLRFTPGALLEDEEFTPQLILRAEQLYHTDSKAYYYRQRDSSLMHNVAPQHIARRLSANLDIILKLQQKAARMPEMDRVALQRRVAQLSMDYLYNTIRLTHSHRHLKDAIDQLRQAGLFPLPDKHYTRKYTAFRRMINTSVGRRILLMTIR